MAATLFAAVWLLALESPAQAVFLKGARSWCTVTMKTYGIVPGRNWGTLDDDAVRDEWNKNKCDDVMKGSRALILLQKETWCADTQKAHGIIPGRDWGTLHSDEERHKWADMGCDQVLKTEKASGKDVTAALLRSSPAELAHKWCTDAQAFPMAGSDFDHAWQSFDCDNLLAADGRETPEMWCWNTGRLNDIVPGVTLGSLSDDGDRQKWVRLDCDKLFSERAEKAREELLAGKVPALSALSESEASAKWCKEKGIAHGVEPGASWGTLSGNERKQWQALGCDKWFTEFAEKENLVLLARNAHPGRNRHVSLVQKETVQHTQASAKKIKPNKQKTIALMQRRSSSSALIKKGSAFFAMKRRGMTLVKPPVHHDAKKAAKTGTKAKN
eukprot:TRINITY_DN62217_c0_g1_i1.p1 TRINITY_DN62217_c0_g1~~TRINITY_DN62217_c0_g1_i1.p1  ORF type:complete len:404 (+),score=83.95 TRINITY_DN62217_c0_g1_i1:55-1212(+)